MANEIRIPQGYVLARESKSERLQLLVRPTTLKKLKEEAEAYGISLNEVCNRKLDASFLTTKCIKEGTVLGHTFKVGEMYPMLGNNNGAHICFEYSVKHRCKSYEGIATEHAALICHNINGEFVPFSYHDGEWHDFFTLEDVPIFEAYPGAYKKL